MALKGKQQRFVEELLADKERNATAAYRKAYPKCKSDDAARAAASRLLASANVKAALDEADATRVERMELTQDEVVTGLRTEAKDRSEKSSAAARVSAWSWLGKHLGMFRDVTEVIFPQGIPLTPADAEAGNRKAEEFERTRRNRNTNGTTHASNGTVH